MFAAPATTVTAMNVQLVGTVPTATDVPIS